MKKTMLILLCVLLVGCMGMSPASEEKDAPENQYDIIIEHPVKSDDAKVIVPEYEQEIQMWYEGIALESGGATVMGELPEKAIPDQETAIAVATAYYQAMMAKGHDDFSYNQKIIFVIYDEDDGHWEVVFTDDLGEFNFSTGARGIVMKESTGEFVAYKYYI